MPNTDYRVTIPKGLRDLQGNEVQNATFDFTVAPPPLVADASTAIPTDAAPTLAPIATAPAPTTTSEPATEPATATTAVSPATATTIAISGGRSTDRDADGRAAHRSGRTNGNHRARRCCDCGAPTATATTARPVATSTPSGTTVSVAAAATRLPHRNRRTRVAPAATATTAPTGAPTAQPRRNSVPATPTTVPTAKPGVPVAPSFQGAYAQTANRLGEPTGVTVTDLRHAVEVPERPDGLRTGPPVLRDLCGRKLGHGGKPGGSGAAMANPGGGYAPGGAYGAAWTNAKLSGKLGYATAIAGIVVRRQHPGIR